MSTRISKTSTAIGRFCGELESKSLCDVLRRRLLGKFGIMLSKPSDRLLKPAGSPRLVPVARGVLELDLTDAAGDLPVLVAEVEADVDQLLSRFDIWP